MKTSVNTFFIVIAFLLGTVDTVAKNNPPVPNPNGKTADTAPPGFPIDEDLLFLLIFAVFFGMYIIYNSKLRTKSPI
jgi:hypothetical protein